MRQMMGLDALAKAAPAVLVDLLTPLIAEIFTLLDIRPDMLQELVGFPGQGDTLRHVGEQRTAPLRFS